MITFQVERFPEFIRDAAIIMPLHWAELALDKASIPLSVDKERFTAIDEQGLLHIVTVRSEGRLVGYFLAIVMPHLHYKDAGLMAFTDMYFILPEFRTGGCGAKLFKEVERTLSARGVKKAYLSCKVHQDHSALFEKLGWKFTDKSFCKMLGA